MGRRTTRLSGSLENSAMANPSTGEAEKQPGKDGNPSSQKPERQTRELLSHGPNPNLRKKARTNELSVIPRRSARLQSPVMTDQNTEGECVIQQIVLTAGDEEDEPLTSEDVGEGARLGNEIGDCQQLRNTEVGSEPLEQISGNKTIEEKLDYLLEHFVSKLGEKFSASEILVPVEARYKSLYIDAQKTIESLKEEKCQVSSNSEKMIKNLEEENRQLSLKLEKTVESLKEENRQLSLKLEYALGKLDAYDKAYEKGTSFCSDVLVKVKDVISAFHVGDTSRNNNTLHNNGPSPQSLSKDKETSLMIKNTSSRRKRFVEHG